MNKELFISSTPHETKVAVVEDDQLAEIYFERENEYTLAGSIYKGRVTRVLPGMQSAFVDIGLERDAFLYVTDFLEESEESEDLDAIPMPAPREGRSQRDFARSAAEQQPRGHDIQPHLIDPSQAPVVFEGGDDSEAPSGTETSETSNDQGEEGARRWRGRRRRGRGRRGRGPEGRPNGSETSGEEPVSIDAQAGDADEGPEEEQFGDEGVEEDATDMVAESPEAVPAEETSEPEQPREYRGRDSRGRGRGDRGRDRGDRGDRGGRDFGPPPGYEPIVLPGESLAKYSRGEQRAETSGGTESTDAPASAPAMPAFTRRRPSTEVDDITAVQEVRALDRGRTRSTETRSEDAGTEILAGASSVSAEEVQHDEVKAEEVKHGPGPEVLGDTSDHDEPAAAVVSSATEEEERDERMNVAAVFGGDEAKPEAAQTEEESTSEFHRGGAHEELHAAAVAEEPHAEHALENQASEEHHANLVHEEVEEHAEHGAPGGTIAASFAPGEGHVEEEEILDEEFSDEEGLHHHHSGSEEEDLEELEEEVLDRIAADQHQTRVQQLAEAVEETGADMSALAGDDSEAEMDEADFVEEENGEVHEEFTEEEIAENGGSAEVRASAGTANFQQRSERTPRPQFDRRRGRGGRRGGGRRPGGPRHEPHRTQMISELLKEGQEILVQIAKEPIGKKGARITSHIALPGRFLVYMPTVNHIGVSRKISSDEERQRLKRIVISERENGHGGFIVRTAADHAPEDELRADIRFLKNLWHEIKSRAEAGKAPALIYHDLNLVERILRDQVNENFSAIWVDTEQDYERMLRFVNRFQPNLVKRVKLYTKETPLFEQFNIQDEINKALKSKVWLKSGGYIVINQTEALVAIDVNTGKYVGKTSRLEDTIVKTNVDAIKEIVRQVRLRDLGGIIVIDFIDMDERRNRQKVMMALEEALRSDRAPSKVLQFNDFGLVAITRKRVKQSLERTLGAPCGYCSGTGFTKAVSTVCNEIWVEMRKMAKHFDHPDIMLRVNPEVAKALKSNGGRWIQEIEELTKRNLIVKTDPLLHQEQFDIN